MTDSERVAASTRSFLEEHPDLEDTLLALHEHEQTAGSWGFDDAPLDSGRFGELVSREFVEPTDNDAYRFADHETVKAVLEGDAETTTVTTPDADSPGLDVSLPEIDVRLAGVFTAALALVVAVRSMYYTSVFQQDHVVSPANDPYFYRYWQERLLEHAHSTPDASMLAAVGEQTRIRPLSHWLNWWFTDLLGGTPEAASTVAAAQPIVASVLLAVVLYALVITLTADHRIALTAVLLFAMTPVLVVYTALGFLEHRPYQYLWLGLIAFTLVWLAVDLTRHRQAGHETPAGVPVNRSVPLGADGDAAAMSRPDGDPDRRSTTTRRATACRSSLARPSSISTMPPGPPSNPRSTPCSRSPIPRRSTGPGSPPMWPPCSTSRPITRTRVSSTTPCSWRRFWTTTGPATTLPTSGSSPILGT